jgi:hypothetical protein
METMVCLKLEAILRWAWYNLGSVPQKTNNNNNFDMDLTRNVFKIKRFQNKTCVCCLNRDVFKIEKFNNYVVGIFPHCPHHFPQKNKNKTWFV